MTTWGFTLKCNYNVYVNHRYDDQYYLARYARIVVSWRHLGATILNESFERDSTGKLHIHGVIKLPRGFYRKTLMTTGDHLDLVKLPTLGKIREWSGYCDKDQDILVLTPVEERVDPPKRNIIRTVFLSTPIKGLKVRRIKNK